ncbi:DNA-binding transcriptional MerR regulator [Breznakia sp. PF5-3]|uniref:MerR family transcriptional regulator n=1 Tax=unclassified Breznakia TaxID=2623764 RepID=UPI0024068B02|nr:MULTISPECIES: MerR family transcriptional regulator [unclassified Breznakia]MDF9825130.1 DNA-binding transcriptional MerR regulator [Breznakia sp. PM6-1]MDF9836011.1 DNA-binding transcriptional MerR regulator [Breznakia sp. PF5-3]MDF9838109.1 DNA-binding transcriptional MerR regulator [Breznakia sp. PFB2-8]MDF9860061.1 DNA-binding transcriptional MerR regulator [Breznakia sp. PH5-24]
MFQIGTFSKLTGISIDRLRNYDNKNILKPTFIDDISGYRYYSEEQIAKANRIQILIEIGFSLKEIATISTLSQIQMIDLVKQKRVKANDQLLTIKRQIALMDYAINDLQKKDEFALSLNIKKIPSRKVVSLRQTIKRFEDEGMLWEKLSYEVNKYNIKFVNASWTYAFTHSIDLVNNEIDTEVQKEVSLIQDDIEDLKFKEIPQSLVASVVFKGGYENIQKIHDYVDKWIKVMGYKWNGSPFQIYYISPAEVLDEDGYITEMCYPIIK